MYDFCIFNVPKMDLRAPSIGLAQLNGSVKHAGYTSTTFDLNILLWRELVQQGYGHWWTYTDDTLVDHELYEQQKHIIEPAFRKVLTEHLPPAKVIGVSLFCVFSFIPLKSILSIVRELNPDSKILLGGPGVSIRNRLECDAYFDDLKQDNLYNDFMFGDGDFAIPEYIAGDSSCPCFNDYVQDPRLDRQMPVAIPDYTDFNFAHYPKKHLDVENFAEGPNNWIYITGSKGCVRDCSFCDVRTYFGIFKTKTGRQIAEEMIHQHKTVGVDKFRFTDSLLNGNLRVLETMCKTLLTYDKKLLWHGQYICRNKKQQSPEFYDMMAAAGLDLVSIGIESGSESVRTHMKKHFDNESLYYTLDQLKRVGIKFVPLMMVGYPTETEEDFIETLKFIDRLPEYEDVIVDLNLNNPTRILPGSPLEDNVDGAIHYDALITDYDFTASWTSDHTDYAIRIERFFRFHNQLNKNGLSRSYAGGDFRYYRDEYLKATDNNPDPEMTRIIQGVLSETYYNSTKFYS
jgi:radical SAM superfamily enzyme YgiQ (UPF0313 family)